MRRLEGWTPAGERHGVQNRGWDGIGRHAWKGKASKIEKVGRTDASRRTPWRPELRIGWNWTLRMDVTGVQNGEGQKNGRQQENAVASRVK